MIYEEAYRRMKEEVARQVDMFDHLLRNYEQGIKDTISMKKRDKQRVEEIRQQLSPLQRELDMENKKLVECRRDFNDYMATTKN